MNKPPARFNDRKEGLKQGAKTATRAGAIVGVTTAQAIGRTESGGNYDVSFGDSFDKEMGDVWYRMCAHKTLSEKSWGVYDEGVVTSSGIGDGSYDLYVLKNNEDKVVGFCIDFLLDENFDL